MAKRSWARFLASLKPPPLWPINHDRWRRVMLALEIAQFYA